MVDECLNLHFSSSSWDGIFLWCFFLICKTRILHEQVYHTCTWISIWIYDTSSTVKKTSISIWVYDLGYPISLKPVFSNKIFIIPFRNTSLGLLCRNLQNKSTKLFLVLGVTNDFITTINIIGTQKWN